MDAFIIVYLLFSTIFQLFISFCELHWCQKPTRIPTAHLRFWNFKILLIFIIFEARWAVAAARFPSSQTSAAAINQLFMQMQSLLLHTLSLSLNVQVVQGEIKKFCKNFGSFKFVLLKKSYRIFVWTFKINTILAKLSHPFHVHRFSPFAYLWSYDDYELYKNTNICYRLIFGSQRFNGICNGIILNSARNFIKEISVISFPACIWNLFFLLLCDKTGSKQLQILW